MARLLAIVAVGTAAALWATTGDRARAQDSAPDAAAAPTATADSTVTYVYQADPAVQGATGYFIDSPRASNTTSDGSPLPNGMMLHPAYDTNYATDAELQQDVGSATFSMLRCPDHELGEDERSVRVQLAGTDFETGPIINSLLLKAAEYAWAACPQPFQNMVYSTWSTNAFHYDVSEIHIFLPDGTEAFSGTLGTNGQGDFLLGPGHDYHFQHLDNAHTHLLQQQAEAARQAAQTSRNAAYAAAVNAEDAANGAHVAAFFRGVWFLVKLLILAGIGWWLWSLREFFLRLYFSLTPHPAAHLVHDRIRGGSPIDGPELARLIRATPGSRIEQQVRAEQALRLTAATRAAEEARVREMERLNIELSEHAVYLQGQEAMRAAVHAHEIAVAELEALKEWEETHGR